MPKIFTLDEAYLYFNIDTHIQSSIDNLNKKLEDSNEHKEWRIKTLLKLKSLQNINCPPIIKIIHVLKHLNFKGIVINYTLIQNETDVIITYEEKPDNNLNSINLLNML